MLYTKPATQPQREVHPSHKQLHITPVGAPLYVVCAISNPQRYASRYKLYQGFEKHIEESGAILYTVELALRDRQFEVTNPGNPHHIQLRSASDMWFKENLINIGVRNLPADWEYAGYVDADFLFTRADWSTEVIHQLQHYAFVQGFSNYTNLAKDFRSSSPINSFVWLYKQGTTPTGKVYYPTDGAPGGAWFWRRSAFDTVGGMLDICILGSADYHQAYALADLNNIHLHNEIGSCDPSYVLAIQRWSDRAALIQKNIGYVDNFAVHFYHGQRQKRFYNTRWEILRKYKYNPYEDVSYDHQGLLRFTGGKPDMEEAIRQYFIARDEDN